MKIIKISAPNKWYLNQKQVAKEEFEIWLKKYKSIGILMQHKIEDLKYIFYLQFYINVPEDILKESDTNYIKANIAKLILYHLKNNPFQDKLYKCSKCNNWAYFKSYQKGVCVICVEPQEVRWKL